MSSPRRPNQPAIAFFDFDGTLTNKDSFIDFIVFCFGHACFMFGLLILSPIIARFKLKMISNDLAKEKMFEYFFGGMPFKQFEGLCLDYSAKRIPALLHNHGKERIAWHQEQGHEVVIVSASFEMYFAPWCQSQNLGLLATKIEVLKNAVTGKFASPNCNYQEKARRIRSEYNLEKMDVIYAYGDSQGDFAMLSLADQPYYRWRRWAK